MLRWWLAGVACIACMACTTRAAKGLSEQLSDYDAEGYTALYDDYSGSLADDDDHDAGGYQDFEDGLSEEIKKVQPGGRLVLIGGIYVVISAASLVLSLVAIVFAQRCDVLPYSQRVFLQNISLSCLLLTITLVLSAYDRILNDWKIGDVMCKVSNCLKLIGIFAQAYFVVAISCDHVARRRRTAPTRTVFEVATIVFGWVGAAAVASSMLVFARVELVADRAICLLAAEPFPLNDSDRAYDLYGDNATTTSDAVDTCRDAGAGPYRAWLLSAFVVTYLLPIVIVVLLLVLHRAATDDRNKRPAAGRVKSSLRCGLVAGWWIALIAVAYFACWAPVHVYHLARIPGIAIGRRACANFRDYCFTQGYFSCMLLPALSIAYCKPTVAAAAAAYVDKDGKTHAYASSLSSSAPSESIGGQQRRRSCGGVDAIAMDGIESSRLVVDERK